MEQTKKNPLLIGLPPQTRPPGRGPASADGDAVARVGGVSRTVCWVRTGGLARGASRWPLRAGEGLRRLCPI
jgi:hypothetical protein